MSITIIPPELLQGEQTTSTDKPQKFDRQEWQPSQLLPDTSETFRLLGCFSTGHSALYFKFPIETMRDGSLVFGGFKYAASYPGKQPEGISRKTDWSTSAREKIEGEYESPKPNLCWISYSYERERCELMLIPQKGLKESMTEILSEADDYTWDEETGIANFVIKITRKGQGLESSYSILPKVKKTEAAVTKAFDEVKDTAMVSELLKGGHPFVQSREFTSTPEGTSEF